MDYIITAALYILLIGGMLLLANHIGLIGKPISFRKPHVTKEELREAGQDGMEPDIDVEKLRKALQTKTFASSFMTRTAGDFAETSRINDYTPEQLVSMAKRYNINLDHFKIENEK